MSPSGSSTAAAPVPLLRLEALRRVYRMGESEVVALDHASFDFHAGTFWAIMGSSGSGKSTLMNLLGCLDRPTAGRYFFEGDDVSRLDDDALSDLRLNRIGFVFQSFNLIPQLTVRENIELPLLYRGLEPEARAVRAAELAAHVSLETRLNHRPTELSGGQCQRVAIARALANDPRLILADEPTGNLDSHTGEQIMDLLGRLNREGRTIIMVTHESDIAARAGGRLVLRDGRIASVEGEGRCI